MEPEAKRMRVAESKVVHINGLPMGCTEQELLAIVHLYGSSRVLLMQGKNQALVEFPSIEAARTFISTTQYLRGQPLNCNFSHTQELRMNTQGGGSERAPQVPSNVLLVTITNLRFPVNIDLLYQLTSQHGRVLRIAPCKVDSNQFQCFVELQDVAAATNCMNALNGRNIYDECCHIRINYSRHNQVIVGDRGRDYTGAVPDKQPAGMGQALISMAPMGGASAGPMMGAGGMGGMAAMGGMSAGGYPQASQPGAVLLVSNLPEDIMPDTILVLIGIYCDVMRVKIMFNKRDHALVQARDITQAQQAIINMNGVQFRGKTLRVEMSKHAEIFVPQGAAQDATALARDYPKTPLHRYNNPRRVGTKVFPPSRTVHLSNFPEGLREMDILPLLQPYGVQQLKVVELQAGKRFGTALFPSTDLATQAIVGVHNHQFGPAKYLWAAFAKASNSLDGGITIDGLGQIHATPSAAPAADAASAPAAAAAGGKAEGDDSLDQM